MSTGKFVKNQPCQVSHRPVFTRCGREEENDCLEYGLPRSGRLLVRIEGHG
jgi:hypothetical protein